MPRFEPGGPKEKKVGKNSPHSKAKLSVCNNFGEENITFRYYKQMQINKSTTCQESNKFLGGRHPTPLCKKRQAWRSTAASGSMASPKRKRPAACPKVRRWDVLFDPKKEKGHNWRKAELFPVVFLDETAKVLVAVDQWTLLDVMVKVNEGGIPNNQAPNPNAF